MTVHTNFSETTANSSCGLVSICGRDQKLTVGNQSIDLDSYEVAIIDRLMIISPFLPNGFKAKDMARSIGFINAAAFEDKFQSLIEKLRKICIANDGGNGSFYEDTIYADELFISQNGNFYFNESLASLVGHSDYLSDQQLESISFAPRNYVSPFHF